MESLANTLSQTPLPTIFVASGILFWILAIAGSLAGKITIEPGMRLTAQIAGTAFIILGVILFFALGSTQQSATEATPKPSPVAATPTPMVATAPSTAAPTTPPPSSTATSAPSGATTTALSPPALAHSRPSPGVNCTGSGSPDEVVICGDARLVELDWQLYDLYHEALSGLDKDKDAQTKLTHAEGVWVVQRGACKSDASCLIEAYNMRIAQLKAAH